VCKFSWSAYRLFRRQENHAGQKSEERLPTIAIHENLNKVSRAGLDRLVVLPTSPAAIAACQKDVQDL